MRFILAVVTGELKLSNRRKADIEGELEAQGYDRLPTQKKAAQQVRRQRRQRRRRLQEKLQSRAPAGGGQERGRGVAAYV